MKKLLSILAVLVCVLSFTACGEVQLTEMEQMKVSNCETIATSYVIPVLSQCLSGNFGTSDLNGFTMEELGYIASQMMGIDEVDGYGFYNAVASFASAADSMGDITNISGVSGKVDDKQIIIYVQLEGTKRAGEAEIIFSNDMFYALQSASLNPSYTFGEKMQKAGLNTVIGICTVFVMLILISLIISLFAFIPKIEKAMADAKAKKEAAKNGIENAVSQIVEQETANGAEELADDTELVAVIAAAIAAYEGAAGTDGFVVRSIRRVRR